MAVYDQLISRTDAAGLIPGPAVVEIEQALERTSIAFELFNRVPTPRYGASCARASPASTATNSPTAPP